MREILVMIFQMEEVNFIAMMEILYKAYGKEVFSNKHFETIKPM